MLSLIKYKKSENILSFLCFLLISFCALFFATKSSPFYIFNDWVDPNAYMTMAKGWLSGLVPYRDLFDHKGPVLYIIYIAAYLISNNSFLGVYIMESIFLAVSLFFIFKIARLFLDRQYAYISSILFIPVFCSLNKQGGSAEEFTLAFQIIFLYIFFRFFRKKIEKSDIRLLFCSGILIGIIALIKFNIVIYCFILLIPIICTPIIDKNISLAIKYIICVSIGILCALLPFIIYFYTHHSLNDFIQSYILFNQKYGNADIRHALGFLIPLYTVPEVAKPYILCNSFIIGGLILFMFKNIQGSPIYKLSLILAFWIAYISIYSSASVHPYSYLPLTVFSILFPIGLFSFIKRKGKMKSIFIPTICIAFTISASYIFKRSMINSRTDYMFPIDCAQYINSNKNNTCRILQISLDKGLLFLTKSPAYNKYYYRPNISFSRFPELYNSYLADIDSETPPHYIYYEKELSNQTNTEEIKKELYLEKTINSRYILIKDHLEHNRWITIGQYLYKLKEE